MKRIIFLAVAFLVVKSQDMLAWSSIEHDAIVFIAECNLKPKAKKRIESYLGGRSIVYYAAWMDHVRKTPDFIFSDTWHMSYVDENLKYMDAANKETYRCVPALEDMIAKLNNYPSLNDSTVAVSLKFMIHLVADMHCPSHVAYVHRPSFNVKYNGVDISYHSVWDYAMLRHAHMWSYTEYQQQLDRSSAQEKKRIMQGTPRDWFEQTARDCIVIYDWAKPGENLGVDFMNKARNLGESQMVIAGYRLAYLLNKLFG